MSERKGILLRLDPAVHDALARWAADELRSTNAQIEFLLRRALADAGRLPGQAGAMRGRAGPRGKPSPGSGVTSTRSMSAVAVPGGTHPMTSDAVTAAEAGTWLLADLTVNRVGFGAMRLPEPAFPRAVRVTGAAIAALRRAVELGVNHIDTAAFYFSSLRSANELIDAALAPYPDDLVITTKVGPGRDPSDEWLPGRRRTNCGARSRRTCACSASMCSTL